MANAQSASPDFTETINILIDRYMSEVHTCMPGVVVAYNAENQTATVKPSLKRFIAGDIFSQPLLLEVPIIFPATKTAWLRLPVAEGDPVMLHFSEASLDRWWPNGGEVDPDIPTKFAIADAIAVLGLNAKPDAIVAKGALTSLELVNGTSWVEITAAGKFKLTNGAVELLQVLDDILGHIIGLSTTNAIVGSPCALGPATLVQLNLDRLNLDLLKA